MKKTLSRFIFDTLENKSKRGLGKIVENFIFFLIFTNVVAATIETLPSMEAYKDQFLQFEIFSLGVFFIEYFLRIATAHYKYGYAQKWGKVKYIFSPMMLFDAFVIFPAILSFFFPFPFDAGTLRILRILRIVRINRYSKSLGRIISIIGKHQKDLFSAFLLIFIAVFTLSTFMFYAERSAQPEIFKSIPHAMYWGIITISTIGYGDIVPVTEMGKLLTSISALLGVALYTLPSALLGAAFYAEAQSKEAAHVVYLEQEVAMLRKKLRTYESHHEEMTTEGKEKNKKLWGIFEWMKK